ncbi:MAG: hypothetical protein ACYCQI_16830 [Gammaproteobacteria bacterium]
MQDRTIVVALDMMKDDPDFVKLGAKQQIDLLSSKIAELYKELHAKDPKAMIIIAWPENGICEPNSKFVDISVKDYLQAKMSALTTEMPYLTVVAGSLSVKRPLMQTEHKVASAEDKLKKHISRYTHDFVVRAEAEEGKVISQTPSQVDLHKRFARKLLEPRARIDEAIVISNTSYIFQSENKEGKQVPKIIKYRKMIPFYDIKSPSEVFRPGSATTGGSLVTLHHPESGKPFKIMIDICYEHAFSKLKDVSEKPLLQLILANSISVDPTQILGQHVILVDTKRNPCHIDMNPESKASGIEVHKAKLSSKAVAEGPLPPFYPLECKLIQAMDAKLRELIELKDHFAQLRTIKNFPDLQKQLAEFKTQFPLIKNTRPEWLSEILADNNEKNSRRFVESNLTELLGEINLLVNLRRKLIGYSRDGNSVEGYKKLLSSLDKVKDSQYGKCYYVDDSIYFNQLPFTDDLKNLAKKLITDHTKDPHSQNMNSPKIGIGSNYKSPSPGRAKS